MTWLESGLPRQASTDQRESADRIDPALAAEATESTDATEPTEPTEPIDKIDPLEPMLSMDPSLFRMRPFSQGRRSRQAMTIIPTGARSRRRIVG